MKHKDRPKSVMVLGERIRVTYLQEEPMKDTLGLFDPVNMEIKILDTVYWDRTLCHEIVHAAFYVSGLTHVLEPEIEEAICGCFEHVLFGIYKL